MPIIERDINIKYQLNRLDRAATNADIYADVWRLTFHITRKFHPYERLWAQGLIWRQDLVKGVMLVV